jgi:tyrosinase
MTPMDLTRRDVLEFGAAATAMTFVPASIRAATLQIRPDIASTEGQKMIALYAKAVKAMQDPAINYPPQPKSWQFQAYIHAVPINPFDPANSGGLRGLALKKRIDEIYGNPRDGSQEAEWKQAAAACWATCEHGSPYFTTWHRWYLHYFERICRQMCGDPNFLLPYWNYASDVGGSLQLPAQFQEVSQDPTNPNVLFFDDRGLGFDNPQGNGAQNVSMNASGFLPYTLTQYGPALTTTNMFPSDDNSFLQSPDAFNPTTALYHQMGFAGRLECAPHDNVHSFVGGWMQNPPSAAGDPIFFVHHCQIDRLYASWATQKGVDYNFGTGPNSKDNDPDKNTWLNRMAAFVDENGALVRVKLGDAITTESMGYTYDKPATPAAAVVAAALAMAAPPPAVTIKMAAMSSNQFSVQSGGSTITLTPGSNAAGAAPEASLNAAGTGEANILTLHGVRLLRRPPAPLSVFINLPKGTPPRLNDPYYVGTLNFFNFDSATGQVMTHREHEGHEGHEPALPNLRFDVTQVLQRQLAKGFWDGRQVSVTISTIGADSSAPITYVEIGSVSLDH